MLTVIAYQFVLAGEFPRFPYLTIMDSIVLLTLIAIGATMVQNIITSTLDEGKRLRVDSVCRYAFPVGYYGLLAITLLTAAHSEATMFAWPPASRTGGSSSSPVTYMAPPNAFATRSDDARSRCGPVCPKFVIDVRTRRGLARFSDA